MAAVNNSRVRSLTTIILLIMFLLGISATTGTGFHGTGLICNKCHTMHASEDGELPTMPDEPEGIPEGPNAHLLYKASVTRLCLVCHDDQIGTPDVFGSDINGSGLTEERPAGRFDVIDGPSDNGHNLALNRVNVSGSDSQSCDACHTYGNYQGYEMPSVGCTDCHDPHGKDPGSDGYKHRNLHWATPSAIPEPIFRAFVDPGASGIDVYKESNVRYGAPTPSEDWREVTNVCIDCHHGFMSGFVSYSKTREGANPTGICIRHPNTDTENGVWEPLNKHDPPLTDIEHWESVADESRLPFIVQGAFDDTPEANYIAAGVVAETNEVFCLTCHRVHGSEYNSGVRWPYSEEGSNEGCQQCHNKGS